LEIVEGRAKAVPRRREIREVVYIICVKAKDAVSFGSER